MKKIFLALVAVMMTMGLMAQCPQKKEACQMKQQCQRTCTQQSPKCERVCVYSPETRAMMRVDRIALVVKDLTAKEREQLISFYTAHYIKCDKRKETANPMTKEECRNECNAELRKVLGDDRYIAFLETMKVHPMERVCAKPAPQCGKPCPKAQQGCPMKK
jgi:hypothetical protein